VDRATREAVIRGFHNRFNFTGKTIKRFIEEQEREKENDERKTTENDRAENSRLQ
jgi:hypothetical protein